MPTIDSAAVTAALADHPDGATTRTLATDTSQSESALRRVLATLAEAGTVTRTPASGKGKTRTPETWTLTTSEATDTDTDTADLATGTSPQEPDQVAAPDTDEPDEAVTTAPDAPQASDTPASDEQASDEPGERPVSAPPAAPVSPAPVTSPDAMRVYMVAGILGDHPDGVPAADVVDASGLRGVIVGRVLAAMELAGAAVRAATDDGPEIWRRGDGDLAAVDLANVVAWKTCPTCGHRTRVRNAVTVGRTVATDPGRTADGQRILGKNELRAMVQRFLDEHPGHDFTAGTIGRELGRSSGAVANALSKLVTGGQALLVSEAPMKYTTPLTQEAPAEAAGQ